jgi:hypothetical protein
MEHVLHYQLQRSRATPKIMSSEEINELVYPDSHPTPRRRKLRMIRIEAVSEFL